MISTELEVSGYLLPLLLHCRKQAQRDGLIATENPFIWSSFGKFLQNSDTKPGNLLCLECTSFHDKHVERTEAKVTPRLKTNCRVQHCRQECRKRPHTSPPLPTYLQCIFFRVNLPACEQPENETETLKEHQFSRQWVFCLPFRRRKSWACTKQAQPICSSTVCWSTPLCLKVTCTDTQCLHSHQSSPASSRDPCITKIPSQESFLPLPCSCCLSLRGQPLLHHHRLSPDPGVTAM